MFYIYRTASSQSARALVNQLEGRRVRRFNRIANTLRRGDVIVSWGEAVPEVPAGVTVLNGGAVRSKMTDINLLGAAGVATVEALTPAQYRNRERAEARPAGVDVDGYNNAFNEHYDLLAEAVEQTPDSAIDENGTRMGQVNHLLEVMGQMTTFLGTDPETLPAVVADDTEWLGRSNAHHSGNDLIDPPDEPDFYVKKLNITREWRIHSFDGRSIRAAIKEQQDDYEGTPHPWIRSHRLGWRFSYRDNIIRQAHRNLAHAAVAALGLNFGAVDIGEADDGNLVVLEVNRAPGLDGTTPERYARAIQRYVTDGPNPQNQGRD